MSANNGSYNSDELDTPEWLGPQFMKEVLDQHLKLPDLKIIDAKFTPASAKGDHYASVMFRAVVKYETAGSTGSSTISLIIKTMPEADGLKKDMLSESHIFKTEIAMYTEVLPKFERILREAGDDITFCTPCIYHRLKPRQIMIFEDLLPKGYSVLRRDANIEELQVALSKLAKWHAVSFKLLKENPEQFDHLKYDLTTIPNMMEQDFMTKSLDHFIDMLGDEESLKPYQKYFEPMRGKLNQRYVSAVREYRENRQSDTYYVVCHGDFHLRNLMFKGLDCMLLDFQMSHVGSMIYDITYAVYMLFDGEVQRNKKDELIYYYFQTFLKTLQKIGYMDKLPSLIEFRRQMFKNRSLDFLMLTAFQPIIMHMRQGGDAGEIVEDEQLTIQIYRQKEYIDNLKILLPRMLHLGYFESLDM
ncbi:uncharacterized protein LOC108649069 [Drosophila navojoa]|uniref:uncharacterized protein LOC108649069 n=1 Tax=Drosophila navojoa TaxID=7232 RepID=UPI00084688D4|nr:uncharacterized protein LOC108649069 [Drosophila navojoa]